MFFIEAFGKALNLGFSMAILIAVPTLIGIRIDNHFDTKPIFSLVFALIGSVAAFYQAYRIGVEKNDKRN